MQIRRYKGPDLATVLRQVNKELGPNAAVLNTRNIREGGFFGVMGRQAVEVTVAVDYSFRFNTDPPRASSEPPSRPSAAPSRPAAAFAAGATARQELNEMRVSGTGSAPRSSAPLTEAPVPLSEELERVHRQLVRSQVEADISRQLLRVFDERLALLGEDWSRAQPRFEAFIANFIRAVPGIQLREGRKPLVVMLIGPTGVGKTTTIAKIASHFALIEHRRVAIVSADTYRLGATDQIRRYGDILGIPVKIVETPEEMSEILPQFSGYDLVLVDTAGRSPQNKEQIMQMKQLVESSQPDEIHLVVSMTTKYADVVSIVSRFGLVPVNRVILTKFDETRTFGLLLNVSMKFSMEISYLTNGQQVPDDLEPADPKRLARALLGQASTPNGRPGFPAA